MCDGRRNRATRSFGQESSHALSLRNMEQACTKADENVRGDAIIRQISRFDGCAIYKQFLCRIAKVSLINKLNRRSKTIAKKCKESRHAPEALCCIGWICVGQVVTCLDRRHSHSWPTDRAVASSCMLIGLKSVNESRNLGSTPL